MSNTFKLIIATLCLGALSACSKDEVQCFFYLNSCDDDDGGETGDDNGPAVWCDVDGVCLLEDPDDPLVVALIDAGLFAPHSLGTCLDPSRTWDAFQRQTPIDAGGGRLRAACCADMGCEGFGHAADSFAICMPGPEGWEDGGVRGAIGFGPSQWSPECEGLDPFPFVHDYTMTFDCLYGVACLGFRDECACTCEPTYDSCSYLTDQVHADYGIDPNVDPWELACTGYPWVWDKWAFEDGAWVGSTCEFNQPDPEPGTVPMPLVEIVDKFDCHGSTCGIPVDVVDRLARDPALVLADTVVVPEGDVVVIEDCGVICSALGLADGVALTGVGAYNQSPTSLDAWRDAWMAWQLDGGEVDIHYLTDGEPHSLRLYKL